MVILINYQGPSNNYYTYITCIAVTISLASHCCQTCTSRGGPAVLSVATISHTLQCRHVILPKDVAANVPPDRLMSEAEWRKLGVQQSRGWVHYMVHKPGMCMFLYTEGHTVLISSTDISIYRATYSPFPSSQAELIPLLCTATHPYPQHTSLYPSMTMCMSHFPGSHH